MRKHGILTTATVYVEISNLIRCTAVHHEGTPSCTSLPAFYAWCGGGGYSRRKSKGVSFFHFSQKAFSISCAGKDRKWRHVASMLARKATLRNPSALALFKWRPDERVRHTPTAAAPISARPSYRSRHPPLHVPYVDRHSRQHGTQQHSTRPLKLANTHFDALSSRV
jgi:phage-related protein